MTEHHLKDMGSKDEYTAFRVLRHDLRTLANQIVVYSELLLEESEDSSPTVFMPDLHKIHLADKQLLGLINDRLMPATVETNTIDHELGSLGISAVR